ncbi:U32 family peptidase [Oscillospiraceae bacterium HV4-5-C5C]|nr:U32 family peptidase [Oscillospiraceae bacterium HV4-5-C5C]
MKTELLAPAGSQAMLEAAINTGADAVYFGVGPFHARSLPQSGKPSAAFQNADLAGIVRQAQQAGLKSYLTLNTLLEDSELDRALLTAGAAVSAGISAVLVQDLGLAVLLHQHYPELPLHASTQMGLFDPEALPGLARLGFSRVVLPRELSLDQIQSFTQAAAAVRIETEVFIQGALCVACSGACLLSFNRGGRSANRGACAQPCRLPYQLLDQDGRRYATNQPYKLSASDISLAAWVQQLKLAGVAALKIEGRKRSPEYVALTVSAYRQILDQDRDPQELKDQLLLAFNRGGHFTASHLADSRDKTFLSGEPGSSGLYCGVVKTVRPEQGWLEIRAAADLSDHPLLLPETGDTLAVRRPGQWSISAPVGKLSRGQEADVYGVKGFHPRKLKEVRPGDKVYRLNAVNETPACLDRPVEKVKLELTLVQRQDQDQFSWSLTGCCRLPGQTVVRRTVSLNSDELSSPAEPAANPSLSEPFALADPAKVTRALTQLGQTDFIASEVNLPPDCRIPLSLCKRLRRNLTADLETELRSVPKQADQAQVSSPVQSKLTDLKVLPSLNACRDPGRLRPEAPFPKLLLAYPSWCGRQQKATAAVGTDCLTQTDLVAQPQPVASFAADTVLILPQTEVNQADPAELAAMQLPLALAWSPLPAAGHQYESGSASALLAPGADSRLQVRAYLNPRQALSAFRTDHLPVWGDRGLNILNQAAIMAYYNLGYRLLTPAAEWTSTALLQTVQRMVAARAWPDDLGLILPLGLWERSMYMKHCPAGLRQKGCQLCQNKRFHLLDEAGRNFPLLCHPEAGCLTELMSQLKPDARQEQAWRQIAEWVPVVWRMDFMYESKAEQLALLRQGLTAVTR